MNSLSNSEPSETGKRSPSRLFAPIPVIGGLQIWPTISGNFRTKKAGGSKSDVDYQALTKAISGPRSGFTVSQLTTDDGPMTVSRSASGNAISCKRPQVIAPTCAYLHQLAPTCGKKNCVQEFGFIRADSWLTSPVKVSRKGKSSLVKVSKAFQQKVFKTYTTSALALTPRQGTGAAVRMVDLSLWFSTQVVGGSERGQPLARLPSPTWYRVLKTALRLRPRRALSSASGQNQ